MKFLKMKRPQKVPEEKLDSLKVELAAEGIPESGSIRLIPF